MKCAHCNVEINPSFSENYLGSDINGHWSICVMECPNPECKKLIIQLRNGSTPSYNVHRIINGITNPDNILVVRPLSSSRPPTPIEVDEKFAKDYKEACLVLPFSTKASAALSRRCLQNILRDKTLVKPSDLSKEIDQIIASNSLPSYLSESIDAIRNIGNFAAHPIKSTSSGEIVEVEQGEAEWLLDVLESMFDFYFVQPSLLQKKKDALNKKLIDANKPPMK